MISPQDLREYVTVMREMGVTTFKNGELAIDLGAAPPGPPPRRDPDAPALPPRRSNYDAMLFACTEGLPEDGDE